MYNEILLSHEKKWNNAICKHMDGPRNYTKWSKLHRKGPISYDITCMWNLKYDTNELIYETETDTDIKKETYDYQMGKVEWVRSLGLTDTNYYM